jgi:diacylglycerol kinase (ATP)
MGTANNVARSLGLGVEPLSAVLALKRATERSMDLGVAQDRRTKSYFVEGFGVGVFAHVMGEKAGTGDKSLREALALIADELDAYEPRRFELEVDGSDCSGTYVLAAMMNIRSFGPALSLAPDARCDDGQLDVVLVRPEGKVALAAHLRRAVEQGDIALPAFETIRAKHVRVRAEGVWAHIDDVALQLEGETLVDAAAGVVKVLAPPQLPIRGSLERRC